MRTTRDELLTVAVRLQEDVQRAVAETRLPDDVDRGQVDDLASP